MAFKIGFGECSYNGFDMTNRGLRSKITAKPILDDAERARKWVEYDITCTFYLSNNATGAGCDLDMEDIRRRLTQPGGALRYVNKGFGQNLRVNDGSGKLDAKWGPIPELLDWTPLGGNVGCRVEWRCTVRIPECDGATTYKFGIAALTYEWETDIDQDGYTSLMISGSLEIPMTRQNVNDRTVSDSADRYRNRIKPAVPLGFQRKNQSFKLSKDQRILTFSFHDEQIPFPLPELATKCEVTERLHSTLREQGFVSWDVGFSGTITLAAGVPKSAAWNIIIQIIEARLRKAVNKSDTLVFKDMDVQDNIFGRETYFSFTIWMILKQKTNTISGALESSGMWAPLAYDPQRWAASLANLSHHERGQAKVAHNPNDMAIIDLCTNRQPSVLKANPLRSKNGLSQLRGFSSTRIDPEASWLSYWIVVDYAEKANVSVLRAMAKPRELNTSTLTAYGTVNPGQKGGLTGARQAAVDNVIQEGGSSNYHVRIIFSIMRIGFEIPVPELDTLGGRAATEVFRRVITRVDSRWSAPIYHTFGFLDYVLSNVPGGIIGPPSNPFLGTSTSSNNGSSSLTTGSITESNQSTLTAGGA